MVVLTALLSILTIIILYSMAVAASQADDMEEEWWRNQL